MSARRITRIHDAVLGRTRGRAFVRMVEHLRSDADDRAIYDRGTLAMRALERREVASSELELVERWLEHDGVLAAGRVTASQRPWAWIAVAFAMAAAAVLALRPVAPPEEGDRWQPKGVGYARPLGLQLLCDDGHAATRALFDVTTGSCPLGGTLSFAIRVDDHYSGGAALTVFGIDEAGEVLYYVPVPDDTKLPTLVHGRWQPLSRAVRLSVNHRPGRVRVFGLLSPSAPSLDAIDEAAAVLAQHAVPGEDDPPWHERIGGALTLLAACGAPGQCASAELELRVGDPPP